MYVPPKNDVCYSQGRLNSIMGRRRLSFNPYTVSDDRLMEIVHSVGWGNEYDLVQMVVLRFTRLTPIDYSRRYGGIYMCIGNSEEEIYLPGSNIACSMNGVDSGRTEHFMLGKRILRNDKDIEYLVGKKVFVSHGIRVSHISRGVRMAYRMHRLSGKTEKDAQIIRTAMCASKIEMLERLIAYPESPFHLSCVKGLFDYETRIRQAIELIRHFPEAAGKG